MSWWLIDHANLVFLVLGLAGFVLATIYWQNRRVKPLVGIGVVLLLMVLFWFMSRLIVTDRKQLELNVLAMANATVEKRPDILRTYLAQNFTYHGMRRTDVAERVVGMANRYDAQNYYISDFQVEEVSRQARRAKISFRLRVDDKSQNILGAFLCKAEFILETDTWCLSKIDVFNPAVNQDQPIVIHLP